MKTLTFLFAGFFLALNIFGQNPKLTKEHIDRFYKTKTLIVLEDNPLMEYNFIIQDVIKNEWRLTEYEFIQYKEFEEKRMDPQYSFLIMLIDGFERDKTKARYKFLHILLGGDYFRINQMPDLGGIPIAYESVPEEEYIYKMTSILR